MKRLLLICLVFLGVALTVKANGEPDFASKYLMLYGQTYDIDCKTISPQMMERILSGVAGSEDENTMRVLSQIKSIRILTTEPNACQAKTLFETVLGTGGGEAKGRPHFLYAEPHGLSLRQILAAGAQDVICSENLERVGDRPTIDRNYLNATQYENGCAERRHGESESVTCF